MELTALFSVMIILLAWGVRIFIVVLLVKALLKYLNDKRPPLSRKSSAVRWAKSSKRIVRTAA